MELNEYNISVKGGGMPQNFISKIALFKFTLLKMFKNTLYVVK